MTADTETNCKIREFTAQRVGRNANVGSHDTQVPTIIYRLFDTSFWGMAVTQFLGAFNDNVFKQLILLLATPTVAQSRPATADDCSRKLNTYLLHRS